MTESETLKALGEQYAAEADKLEEMITSCRERRRFALQGGNSAEACRQERLMELHAQQRSDLLRLSVWLRNYYGGTFGKKGGELSANHQSCTA